MAKKDDGSQPVAAKLKSLAVIVQAATRTAWTNEWPQEPGRYWFYGVKHSSAFSQEPALYSVDVQKTANGAWMYLSDGAPIWPAAGAEGAWQPALLPGLPKGVAK